jgi:gamma-glutamylcyclotransferase (GGCT)/AIG2-like uncharacterized protein YtfP
VLERDVPPRRHGLLNVAAATNAATDRTLGRLGTHGSAIFFPARSLRRASAVIDIDESMNLRHEVLPTTGVSVTVRKRPAISGAGLPAIRALAPASSCRFGLAVFGFALTALLPVPAHAKGGEVGGSGNEYHLNDAWSGSANHVLAYGTASDSVVVGDWNGDGPESLGVRRGNTYYLRNAVTSGSADQVIVYGRSDDVVLVGDWDGDGRDTLTVRRGSTYYVKNDVVGGVADVVLDYGKPDDVVLVGDWDGDGRDTLAVRRGATYYVKNNLDGGVADVVLDYGKPDDVVLVGDWDGDRRDTFAVRRESTYFIKNGLAGGVADYTLVYGRSADTGFAGDWNGDGKTTLGVRRPPPPANPAVFAYGTLRTGQQGASLLDGRTTQRVITAMAFLDMYRLSGSTYPFAVPNAANTYGIVGEEMHLVPSAYADTIEALDRYERYDPAEPPDNQSYVRELRNTHTGTPSWVYVAGPRMAQYLRSEGVLISSGDFLRW